MTLSFYKAAIAVAVVMSQLALSPAAQEPSTEVAAAAVNKVQDSSELTFPDGPEPFLLRPPGFGIDEEDTNTNRPAVAIPSTVNISDPFPSKEISGAVDLNGKPISINNASPVSVCGDDSLQVSNYGPDCKIYATFPNDETYGCTAWIAGSRFLGTAGHCLYRSSRGGYAKSVSVVCTGRNVCNVRATTYATRVIVSGGWIAQNEDGTSPYDGGAIETQDTLPYTPYTYGQRGSCSGSNTVEMTGYPGSSTTTPGCNQARFNKCTQFTSRGSMSCQKQNGFYRANYDSCGGNSGSGVFDNSVGWITAIHVVGTSNPCGNLATPLVLRENADQNCNGNGGGVSMGCLINKFF